jgi:hypothetical protein
MIRASFKPDENGRSVEVYLRREPGRWVIEHIYRQETRDVVTIVTRGSRKTAEDEFSSLVRKCIHLGWELKWKAGTVLETKSTATVEEIKPEPVDNIHYDARYKPISRLKEIPLPDRFDINSIPKAKHGS